MGNQVDEAMDRIARYEADKGKPMTYSGPEAIDRLRAAAGLTGVREKTHGDFKRVAMHAQKMRAFVRDSTPKDHLTYAQQEALDMIFLKIARIIEGDPNCLDHWDDIAGYAYLGAGRKPA